MLGRSLTGFCADFAPAQLRWTDHFTQAQWEPLQRELHTFKGLAATLGLQAVSALAAQAEQHTKTCAARGEPVHPADRRAVEQAIQDLSASVDEILPTAVALAEQLMASIAPAQALTGITAAATPKAPPSTGAALSENAAQTLRHLHELLEASDMRAMEVHALLFSVMPADWADRLAPLDAAMSNLEFEEAAEICRGLMAQSGVL